MARVSVTPRCCSCYCCCQNPSLTVGDLVEGFWPERRRAVGAGRVHAVDTAVLVARPALGKRAERGAERQAQNRDDAGQ